MEEGPQTSPAFWGPSQKKERGGHKGGFLNPRPGSGSAWRGLLPSNPPQAPLLGQLWARRVPPRPAGPRAHLAGEAGRVRPGAGPGQERGSAAQQLAPPRQALAASLLLQPGGLAQLCSISLLARSQRP